MSSKIVCQVFVILCLNYACAKAYMYGYPTHYGQPYPIAAYPYAPTNNFPYQQMYPSYGQVYSNPINYPIQQEIPLQSHFNQYEGIHQNPNLPIANFYPGQGQGQAFPLFPPQSIATAYGNIPIEIIDVDPPGESSEVTTSKAISLTAEQSILSTSRSDAKKNIDIIPKPVQTSSIVHSAPTEAKIVRTFDSTGVKVYVETSSLPPTKLENDVEDNTESNDATTRKPFSLFGI